MKKLIKLILVIIILAIGGLYIYFNTAFKDDAAAYASKITGTNVAITAVTLNPFEGSVSLRGLSIANPAGYKDRSAIDLGQIQAEVDLKSLLTDNIIINNFSLDDAEINYELKNQQDNLRTIMNNVKRNSSKASTTGSSSGGSSDKPKDFLIKKLNVTNSSVVLAAQVFDFKEDREIEIPDIHLTDVTQANISAKLKTLADKLIRDVAKVAVKEQLNKQINKATDKVKERLNDEINGKLGDAVGGKLKDLF